MSVYLCAHVRECVWKGVHVNMTVRASREQRHCIPWRWSYRSCWDALGAAVQILDFFKNCKCWAMSSSHFVTSLLMCSILGCLPYWSSASLVVFTVDLQYPWLSSLLVCSIPGCLLCWCAASLVVFTVELQHPWLSCIPSSVNFIPTFSSLTAFEFLLLMSLVHDISPLNFTGEKWQLFIKVIEGNNHWE